MRATPLIAGLVVLAFGGTALAARAVHRGDVLPGTHTLGLDLGGRSEAAARLALQRVASQPLVLRGADRTLRLDPGQAGAAVDADATLRRVLEAGRSGPLAGAWSTVRGLVARRDVAPVLRIDEVELDAATRTAAERFGRGADDGGISVDPQTLEATVKPSRPGRGVERARLRARITAAVRKGRTVVDVPLRTRPPAPRDAVRRVADEAERYVRDPLVLRAAGQSLTVGSARLAPLLRLGGEGRRVALAASAEGARKLAAELAAQVDRPAREPRFALNGPVPTVEGKGEVSWRPVRAKVAVTPGRSGRSIDLDRATTAIREAVADDRHEAELPLRETQPAVGAEAARKVRFVIGTFTTRYEPGQPRVQNIRRIARSADGAVIPPGGTFSLNEIAGRRTKDKGYVEAPFIADGKLVPSVGGGVSQFSTTTYNAAYFAGLRLDTSQPHSLYIDRYPPGREATLNFPDIDLRWTNDTDAPVAVLATSDATSVTVRLLGDNGGRRVQSVPGQREPLEDADFAITVTRVVRYADGRVERQPRTTRYEKLIEAEPEAEKADAE